MSKVSIEQQLLDVKEAPPLFIYLFIYVTRP